jgi:hypothetical protein
MKRATPYLAGALCVMLAAPVGASQYVYPAKGQSASQQHKDEAACRRWAINQSGYDPAHPPTVVAAQAAPVTGSGARMRGAAGGALIGAVAGNAGAGAAAGALAGGVTRRVRNQRAADEQNAASQQHIADMRAGYYRARGACLSGRGYTVK